PARAEEPGSSAEKITEMCPVLASHRRLPIHRELYRETYRAIYRKATQEPATRRLCAATLDRPTAERERLREPRQQRERVAALDARELVRAEADGLQSRDLRRRRHERRVRAEHDLRHADEHLQRLHVDRVRRRRRVV